MKNFIIAIIAILFFTSKHSFANSDKYSLELRVKSVMKKLDSETYLLSTYDFIVSMYQQILNKNPNDLELSTAQLLLDGYGIEVPLERSHFVEQLLVLKGQNDYISWQTVKNNIALLENLEIRSRPIIGVYSYTPQMHFTKKTKHYLHPVSHNKKYKVYFGFLHAHSELSDGRGDAKEAYEMARTEAKLDYFALTDHAELLHFWPWNKKYKQLKELANQFNQNGRFAALYGFEWSHPLLGHFNIINTERYTSAILAPTMGLLMNWLSKKPTAFGRFNHPGRINIKYWPWEFRKLKVYHKALHNVVGIEMWNKDNGIKKYLNTYTSFKKNHNFLDNANLNGWFVGAVGGQDNHHADWGLRNDYRVGVWAEKLSREQIVQAYLGRRTFATEDKNAWVSFKINNSEMGSRLNPGKYNLELQFGDADGEKVKTARLVKKGKKTTTYKLNTSQKIFDKVESEIGDYYYIVAEQEDGDILLSSPIWIVPVPQASN